MDSRRRWRSDDVTFYDDSLRPKSFLHDEVDEFNRVLAELLCSPAHHAPPQATSDACCGCSAWSRDAEDDCFQTAQPGDGGRKNSRDCETPASVDVERHVVRPSVADRTAPCDYDRDDDDDDDDDGEVDVDDDDVVLEIVEDQDRHPATDVSNAASSQNFFTDDLMNEDDADSGYQSGNSTMVAPHQISADRCSQLWHRVDCYNSICLSSAAGLTMTVVPGSDVFQGFIRVHMNLHKPISVAVKSPCVRDVTAPPGARDVGGFDDDDTDDETESFYLPPNTSKVIHVTSEMTTPVVIQTLLDKFLITDSCQKFALYEKINNEHPKTPEERRLNGMLRRLSDEEKPLQLCLRWSDDGAESLNRRQFVLQDNVTSDIAWDAFSLPELEAFLRILNREEESYCYQIRLKYGAKKKASEMRLRQLADDAASQRGTVTTAGHA